MFILIMTLGIALSLWLILDFIREVKQEEKPRQTRKERYREELKKEYSKRLREPMEEGDTADALVELQILVTVDEAFDKHWNAREQMGKFDVLDGYKDFINKHNKGEEK